MNILREVYPPELPYGFAERVAAGAFRGQREEVGLWDALLELTPRTSLAIGAVVAALAVFGFVGSDPGLFEAVSHYAQSANLVALP